MEFVTMNDTRDRLQAMIRQQERYYHCADYLEVVNDEADNVICSPLHVVAECANIVSDVHFEPRTKQELDRLLRSPSQVNRFPSPRSSLDDMCHLSDRSTSLSARSIRSKPDLSLLCTWRHQMLDWAYQVVETYSVDREVVAVAFSILDRYVALELETDVDCPLSRHDFQLYSMVSLYIAMKTLIPIRKLTVETLVGMARGFYTAEDVTETEMDILEALNWHVHPPTVIDFCHLYAEMFPEQLSDEVRATYHCTAEVVLADVFFISKPASLVALATILFSAHRYSEGCRSATQQFLENLQGLVNVESEEFDSILRRLEFFC